MPWRIKPHNGYVYKEGLSSDFYEQQFNMHAKQFAEMIGN